MGLLSLQVELGNLLSTPCQLVAGDFGHCNVQKNDSLRSEKDGQERKNDRIQH